MGLALMVGQITAIFNAIGERKPAVARVSIDEGTGSDAAAHMAEETVEAGTAVPSAMVWAYGISSLQSFGVLIVFCFCVDSIPDALADPTGYPFLYVFRTTYGVTGTNVVTALLLALTIGSNVFWNASASRQIWAFARDDGIPFGGWVAKVRLQWTSERQTRS